MLTPDHVQPVGVVAAVPGLNVGEGPLAVDAGVRPEVNEHHFTFELGQGRGRCCGVFSQAVICRNAGALPHCSSWVLVLSPCRFPEHAGVGLAGEAGELLMGVCRSLDLVLQRVGVAGQRPLEPVGEIAGHEHGHGDEDEAPYGAEQTTVAA